ncbi:NAD(P)/FAD-dependent oxidoreductase [Photobacterium minamisatsumaniensis]|uniref:NAD(P)/FAD-dependent oxidoreductase n=1 Tax=Photobacterium minamisatsumaniensis TaxID=2910233 RepID=UPI003D108554
MEKHVVVVGGGMVGVSCALYLLKKQFKVTLIEKNEIGRETSYGNAGVISRGSILPLNNARLTSSLPRYMNNRHPALRYNYKYIINNKSWVYNFISEATEESTQRRSAALNTLITPALAEHKMLMEEANTSFRLRDNGWLKLFRSEASYDGSAYEQGIYRQHNVGFEVVDSAQIHELEPNLQHIFKKGLWITDTASVNNPGEVVAAYARLFTEMGGLIVKDAVRGIERTAETFLILGTRQNYQADDVVLATGPWVNDLLKPFQYRVPMGFERGYHQHFHAVNDLLLNRPFYDVEGSYVMSPTDMGLRISTGVELNNQHASPNHSQLNQVIPKAREAFQLGGECHSNVWLGSRPSLPDAMPIIGAVPGTSGLWLACGHQHIGFSTGPVTGKLIADMVAGESTSIDTQAFKAERFKQSA